MKQYSGTVNQASFKLKECSFMKKEASEAWDNRCQRLPSHVGSSGF